MGNEYSQELIDLAFAALDHGIDSVREGGPLIPFVMSETGSERTLTRFAAEMLEEGLEEFSTVLGNETKYFPEGTFTRLAVIGVPGAPVTLFSGVYRIGDTWTGVSGAHSGNETTIPGTYVVFDVEDCYWERLDNAGNIIDNNFVSAAPRVETTIHSSDYAFNSDDCGRWVRVGD